MPPMIHLTDEQEDTLRRMWTADCTNAEIAEALGLAGGRNGLTRIAHRLNLPNRKQARVDQYADDILRLHESGATPTSIAAKLGTIGVTAVQSLLARRGIEPNVVAKRDRRSTISGGYGITDVQREQRLAADCKIACARCGGSWEGALAETRQAFAEHACAVAA